MVPATIERWDGPPPTPDELLRSLGEEGGEVSRWGNAPGETYGWHSHPYRKVVVCLSGGIVFHTRDSGELELGPGDRLVLEPATDHAATVGTHGVECAEARIEQR